MNPNLVNAASNDDDTYFCEASSCYGIRRQPGDARGAQRSVSVGLSWDMRPGVRRERWVPPCGIVALVVLCAACGSSADPEGAADPASVLRAGTGVPWVVKFDSRSKAPSLAMPLNPAPPIVVAGA